MDQELIAYLDERFGETSREIRSLREEVAASREETAGRFAKTDRQIATLREEFVASREETAQRFERLEEEVRHNGVEIEGMRGDIRQVAEGVAGANEGLNTLKEETAAKFQEVRTEILGLIRIAFEEIRALKTQGSGQNQEGPAPTT